MIATLMTWAAIIVINLIVLGLVPERRRPTSAMVWLLLILLVPVFRSAPPTWTSAPSTSTSRIHDVHRQPALHQPNARGQDLYRSLSHEMTLAGWNTRPITKRWVDNVMRLTSAVQ
jgi:hypothetical protein